MNDASASAVLGPVVLGPVVLVINRTQDPSICLMHGSQLAWAIQKERLSRHKHHWGKPGDLRQHYLPALAGLERPVEVLVECYSSDAEIAALASHEAELADTLVLAPGPGARHLPPPAAACAGDAALPGAQARRTGAAGMIRA